MEPVGGRGERKRKEAGWEEVKVSGGYISLTASRKVEGSGGKGDGG